MFHQCFFRAKHSRTTPTIWGYSAAQKNPASSPLAHLPCLRWERSPRSVASKIICYCSYSLWMEDDGRSFSCFRPPTGVAFVSLFSSQRHRWGPLRPGAVVKHAPEMIELERSPKSQTLISFLPSTTQLATYQTLDWGCWPSGPWNMGHARRLLATDYLEMQLIVNPTVMVTSPIYPLIQLVVA